ncbi:MAG TPA: PorV/PorQ family protein [Vicinamibacterales bacterium]|nr:PorV/PorQ family protein [Vicinamibacterales bacterium]
MRTFTIIRLMLAGLTLAWSAELHAQGTPGSTVIPGDDDRTTRVGTRGANFLHIPIGGRANGMAGATVASVDGPAALFWNPANIATREQLSAFASYSRLYGNSGISDIAAAVSIPVGQGAVGLSVSQFSSGEMQRTTERAPQGDDPVFPGTFEWTGTAVAAHYARNVTDRLTAAVGARYVQEGIALASNRFFGFDVSTRFNTGLYGLTVAASLQNLGSTGGFNGAAVERAIIQPRYNGQPTGRDIPIAYNTRDVQMPTTFNFGFLSQFYGDAEALFGQNPDHQLIVEAGFKDAIDTDLQLAIGAEYGFKRNVFARVGKRWFNEQSSPWEFQDGLSFGGGVKLPLFGRRLTVDYGYVIMGELQNNQVLSFDIGN